MKCYAPWGYMVVNNDGEVSCCCFSKFGSLGNVIKTSIKEVWNSPKYQYIREQIHNGNYTKAGCKDCALLRQGNLVKLPPDVLREKEEEFTAGKKKLNTSPSHLDLVVSHNCNISCVMCWQEHPLYSRSKLELPEKVFQDLKEILPNLYELILIGGEPFFIKRIRKFLSDFPDNKFHNLGISFTTNGTILDEEIIKNLLKFKRLRLVFSIDGVTKEVFEKIRTGANWGKVLDNLNKILEIKQKLDSNYKWQVEIVYVVMRSNFHQIPQAILWADSKKFKITFSPVEGKFLFNENIFEYGNFARHNKSQWRNTLKKAQDIIEQIKEPDYCISLKNQITYLENLLKNAEKKSPFIDKFKIKINKLGNKVIKSYIGPQNYKIARKMIKRIIK